MNRAQSPWRILCAVGMGLIFCAAHGATRAANDPSPLQPAPVPTLILTLRGALAAAARQ